MKFSGQNVVTAHYFLIGNHKFVDLKKIRYPLFESTDGKIMKTLFLIFIMFLTGLAQANSTAFQREFKDFYNSTAIDSNKCGLNIQRFLKHLSRKGYELNDGYVVSLHEDTGYLNHFNARWGSKESYTNGTNYKRQNWYFHVFAVLEGRAYDFSQASQDSYSLREYLERSYLPRYETQNIFLLGKVDRKIMLQKYLNFKFRLYRLRDYKNNLGPILYEGDFFELFQFVGVDPVPRNLNNNVRNIPPFKKDAYGAFLTGESTDYVKAKNLVKNNGLYYYTYPYVFLNGERYPIKFEPKSICQALGHFGTFPALSKEVELTRKMAPLVDISGSLYPKTPQVNVSEDIKVGFRYVLNNQHWNYKIASKLVCGNARRILN